MEHFAKIVNVFQLLTTFARRSILDICSEYSPAKLSDIRKHI